MLKSCRPNADLWGVPLVTPLPLQFRDKDIMQGNVKCITQVQVDGISCSSLIYQCCRFVCHDLMRHDLPLVNPCWLSPVLIFHVHYHSFQEDLFHGLFGYRGETDWHIVLEVFSFSFFKTGGYFYPFKNSLDCPSYSDMMNGLATTGVGGVNSPAWAAAFALRWLPAILSWGPCQTHALGLCRWSQVPDSCVMRASCIMYVKVFYL